MDLRVTRDQLYRVQALRDECQRPGCFEGERWRKGVTAILGDPATKQIEAAALDKKTVRLIVEAPTGLVDWAFSLVVPHANS